MSINTTDLVRQFEDVQGEAVRKRIYNDECCTKDYLDGLLVDILQSRAVEHPFLQWYATNKLTPEQERILFSECFYWFRFLPFYIAGMSQLTRDTAILKEIMLNVLDEVGGEKSHAEIYLGFLEQIGITEEDVLRYTPAAATIALNNGMARLYTEHPVEKALGALYFDEAMSAIMVSKVNDGLVNQGYDEDTRFFWELHIEVEKGHSNSVFNAIFPHAGSVETKAKFEVGLRELQSLVEGFWDQIDTLIRPTNPDIYFIP